MRVRSTTDSVKLTIGGGKRAYFPTSSSTVSPYANGKKGRIRQFLQSRSKMLLLGLLFVFLFLYVSLGNMFNRFVSIQLVVRSCLLCMWCYLRKNMCVNV